MIAFWLLDQTQPRWSLRLRAAAARSASRTRLHDRARGFRCPGRGPPRPAGQWFALADSGCRARRRARSGRLRLPAATWSAAAAGREPRPKPASLKLAGAPPARRFGDWQAGGRREPPRGVAPRAAPARGQGDPQGGEEEDQLTGAVVEAGRGRRSAGALARLCSSSPAPGSADDRPVRGRGRGFALRWARRAPPSTSREDRGFGRRRGVGVCKHRASRSAARQWPRRTRLPEPPTITMPVCSAGQRRRTRCPRRTGEWGDREPTTGARPRAFGCARGIVISRAVTYSRRRLAGRARRGSSGTRDPFCRAALPAVYRRRQALRPGFPALVDGRSCRPRLPAGTARAAAPASTPAARRDTSVIGRGARPPRFGADDRERPETGDARALTRGGCAISRSPVEPRFELRPAREGRATRRRRAVAHRFSGAANFRARRRRMRRRP